LCIFCRARYAQAGVELQRDQSNFELKDSAKKEVLLLWTTTEHIIMGELSRHFVEKDVEDLEDDPSLNPDEVPSLLTRNSSGNFFGLNSQQADMDGLNEEDKLTVCPPSCRLAAPVYKDIMTFSAKVKTLLHEEINANVLVASIVEKSVQRCVYYYFQ
jgi:hypothetical protein